MELIDQNIFVEWLYWQFYQMPKFLFGVWMNYLNFANNLFSVSSLSKTFFAPWRRYNWMYPKGFNLTEFFNTLISNIFSRFLGAMMRTVLIIIGILFQIFVVIIGLIVFILWLILPFLAIWGIFLFLFW